MGTPQFLNNLSDPRVDILAASSVLKPRHEKSSQWDQVIEADIYSMVGAVCCFCINVTLMMTSVCNRLANPFFISYSLGQAC